jgi:hypothetical protein
MAVNYDLDHWPSSSNLIYEHRLQLESQQWQSTWQLVLTFSQLMKTSISNKFPVNTITVIFILRRQCKNSILVTWCNIRNTVGFLVSDQGFIGEISFRVSEFLVQGSHGRFAVAEDLTCDLKTLCTLWYSHIGSDLVRLAWFLCYKSVKNSGDRVECFVVQKLRTVL